jgi:hypothetical protein
MSLLYGLGQITQDGYLEWLYFTAISRKEDEDRTCSVYNFKMYASLKASSRIVLLK